MAVFSGNGSNSAPSFTFSSDTNTGIYRVTTDSLGITTAGTAAAVIDAAQRVIIGGTSSRTVGGSIAARLQVEGDDNNKAAFSLTNTVNGASGTGPQFVTSRIRGTGSVAALDTVGLWQFYGHDGTSYLDAGSIRAQLTSTAPTTGNFQSELYFRTRTGGVVGNWMTLSHDGYLRLNGAGKGIQFNGDTAAANALDDYEEGTWTPAFQVESGTGAWTYNSQTGRYTKVGNKVTCWFSINWATKTGTGTLAYITGVPFAYGTDPSVFMGAVTSTVGITFQNWGGTTGTQAALANYAGSAVNLNFFGSGMTTTDQRLRFSALDTSGRLRGVFTYQV